MHIFGKAEPMGSLSFLQKLRDDEHLYRDRRGAQVIEAAVTGGDRSGT